MTQNTDVSRRKYESVVSLMEATGVKVEDGSRNIMVGCPLAPYRRAHSGKVDSRPSMGLLPRKNKGTLVNCFTCGFKAHSLVRLFEVLAGYAPLVYAALLERASVIDDVRLDASLASLGPFRTWSAAKGQAEYDVFPDSKYAPYAGHFHPYIAARGVDRKMAIRWEAGVDRSANRGTFPIRDRAGSLVGAVGRALLPLAKPKYMHYWDFRRRLFLFGEHLVPEQARLVLVEGILDAVVADRYLGPHGYSVVASMGAALTQVQEDKIVAMAESVTLAFDADEAGHKGMLEAMHSLGRRVHTRAVQHSGPGKDPAELGEDLLPLIEGAKLYV